MPVGLVNESQHLLHTILVLYGQRLEAEQAIVSNNLHKQVSWGMECVFRHCSHEEAAREVTDRAHAEDRECTYVDNMLPELLHLGKALAQLAESLAKDILVHGLNKVGQILHLRSICTIPSSLV